MIFLASTAYQKSLQNRYFFSTFKRRMRVSVVVFLLGFSLFSFSGCKKEEPAVVETPKLETPIDSSANSGTSAKSNTLTVNMSYVFGTDSLKLQTAFLNDKGDLVTVVKFQYYLSNLVFITDDGKRIAEENSYHLLSFSPASASEFTLGKLPAGNYVAVEGMIGIDSTRNCSGAQTGDLDPARGMFWTWNSGYIFLKLEGKSPVAGTNQAFTYHIGGFKGINKTQRSFQIDIAAKPLVLAAGKASKLNLRTDVSEIFKNPKQIDLSVTNYVMNEGANAAMIADNYRDMISLKGVVNP